MVSKGTYIMGTTWQTSQVNDPCFTLMWAVARITVVIVAPSIYNAALL